MRNQIGWKTNPVEKTEKTRSLANEKQSEQKNRATERTRSREKPSSESDLGRDTEPRLKSTPVEVEILAGEARFADERSETRFTVAGVFTLS
ncbi:unnamed protein product [Arabidopsis lyrata]|uniref:Predicted protein n=1 Tax=Arabidopsis lyrata subsp. lyrata TaxID=81972 RepID=D7LPR1_ARALL|nr:predicted protein [Arabidopsis lyrata subsp. lyrata]CAH8267957.1 unnamed protein product [Arabidopsis lyrata]EFH40580.1 predicted protein [Arabidopsis lyrata subsp. lyrata]EFH51698.1 predicted protein [Arabidopsis lyrata subsp. lyrata]EFH53905.1 predicted protein [Arabidopsis lyrata subsp. lyrata]